MNMKRKIGDKISSVATPIANALNLNCVDKQTGDLKPDSTCAKVRDDLNEGRYVDAFYDRFFKQAEQKQKKGK